MLVIYRKKFKMISSNLCLLRVFFSLKSCFLMLNSNRMVIFKSLALLYWEGSYAVEDGGERWQFNQKCVLFPVWNLLYFTTWFSMDVFSWCNLSLTVTVSTVTRGTQLGFWIPDLDQMARYRPRRNPHH